MASSTQKVQSCVLMYFSLPTLLGALRASIIFNSMASPTQKVQRCVLMYFSLPTLLGAFLAQLSFLIQWQAQHKGPKMCLNVF